MPTLDWIGKKAVLNHHNEVPFHLLQDVPDLSVDRYLVVECKGPTVGATTILRRNVAWANSGH